MNVMDMFRVDGKVAMVTGGARHLGYDMADALAEAGADLVITSRTLSSAETSAEKLNKEQKAPPPALLLIIKSDMQWDSNIDQEMLHAIKVKVLTKLNDLSVSQEIQS